MALKYKKLVKSAIIIVCLSLALVVVALLLKSEWISEYIFARGLSRWYITAIGYISSAFPFSVFEVLCACAVIAIIIALIFIIKNATRHHFAKATAIFAKVVIGALSVSLIYIMTATPAYSRAAISEHIPYNDGKLSNEEVLSIANYCLDDFNYLATKMQHDSDGKLISPYTNQQLYKKIAEEYELLDGDYFNPFTASAKPIISSEIMSLFGIIGVSFQPTGESNYNRNTAVLDMPCLIAHELSHSKGVMREGDAELLSAYLTLTSKDEYIRYCGYGKFFGYISVPVFLQVSESAYKEINAKLSNVVRADIKESYNHYEKYDTFIADIGNFFNDIYLKLSGESNGTGSYVQGGGSTTINKPDGTQETIITYPPIFNMIAKVLVNEVNYGKNL